jgi:hypothetical protein
MAAGYRFNGKAASQAAFLISKRDQFPQKEQNPKEGPER